MLNMYNMKPYVYSAYSLTFCIFNIFCILIICFTEKGTAGHTVWAEMQQHVGAH